jgi:hypothetical protein
MPQTNYLPLFTASYPILARAQKPGGVTVLTTVAAGDVPNKHTYASGTIQSFESLLAAVAEWDEQRAQAKEEAAPEPEVEEEEEEVEEDDGNGGTVKRKRTVSRTRTTTRRR